MTQVDHWMKVGTMGPASQTRWTQLHLFSTSMVQAPDWRATHSYSGPMRVPERRRRRLFAAQLGLGALGGIATSVSSTWIVRTESGFWGLPAALLALGIAAVTVGGLWRLDRAKFGDEPAVTSDVDWARELREVRDSRRVIASAFEIERRRIERDLHDGAQQNLVAATMKLGEASLVLEQRAAVEPHRLEALVPLLEGAHRDAEEAMRSLRATVSGIHPQVLTDLGLHAAVSDMAGHSGVDATVKCPHPLPDMPEEVAAVAWFFCSEALTNIAKHAPGCTATLVLGADKDLHVSVMDSGPGGAWLRPRGGLLGMRERLAAFGGTMQLSSPQGGPTMLSAQIPLLLVPLHESGAT